METKKKQLPINVTAKHKNKQKPNFFNLSYIQQTR
jgi:hypothetical protein